MTLNGMHEFLNNLTTNLKKDSLSFFEKIFGSEENARFVSDMSLKETYNKNGQASLKNKKVGHNTITETCKG